GLLRIVPRRGHSVHESTPPTRGQRGAYWTNAAKFSVTITPLLNIESCSSIFTALSPLGMSKAIFPTTVLPGLMLSSQVLPSPFAPERSRSALLLAVNLRPEAS